MKSCPGHSANMATSEVPPDISSRKTTTFAMTSAWVTGGIMDGRMTGLGPALEVPQHFVRGARHVLLQPQQHCFAVIVRLRRRLGRGDHVEHHGHAGAEHFVDRAAQGLVELRALLSIARGDPTLAPAS